MIMSRCPMIVATWLLLLLLLSTCERFELANGNPSDLSSSLLSKTDHHRIVGLDHYDIDETTLSAGIHRFCTVVSSASSYVSSARPRATSLESPLTARARCRQEDEKDVDDGNDDDAFEISGRVVCWGDKYESTVVIDEGEEEEDEDTMVLDETGHHHHAHFVQVVSARLSSCGLKETMSVACWDEDGRRSHNKLTQSSSMFVQLSAGTDHMCGLRLDGRVECFGKNANGESTPPEPVTGSPFIQISCGKNHNCAIDSEGLVTCWGRSRKGQSRSPKGMRFAQISASCDDHTCGIEETRKEDGRSEEGGRVFCWGANRLGQSKPPRGNFVQVTTGRAFSCAIEATTRKVQCWGKMKRFKSDHTWAEITAGHSVLCGITADTKEVLCFRASGLHGRMFEEATASLRPLRGTSYSAA